MKKKKFKVNLIVGIGIIMIMVIANIFSIYHGVKELNKEESEFTDCYDNRNNIIVGEVCEDTVDKTLQYIGMVGIGIISIMGMMLGVYIIKDF